MSVDQSTLLLDQPVQVSEIKQGLKHSLQILKDLYYMDSIFNHDDRYFFYLDVVNYNFAI